MARQIPLKLSKYNISKAQYWELYWFCRRYPEKKQRLEDIRGGFNNFTQDGLPRAQTSANPTEERAMKAIDYVHRADVELIEKCVALAGRDIYYDLLKHVTQGVSLKDLDPPCGINQFYASRRKFYWILAQKRENGENGVVDM